MILTPYISLSVLMLKACMFSLQSSKRMHCALFDAWFSLAEVSKCYPVANTCVVTGRYS